MTPEQIQELARLVAAQVSAPPWWTYLLLAVFSAVSAAIGAGVGAFLKRWGENLATTAAFDRLRKELIANTQAAESVKAALAGRSWLKQQLWVQRERHYMELLSQLSKARRYANVLAEITEPGPDDDLSERHHTVLQARYDTVVGELLVVEEEISNALAPSAVFLSSATHQVISELLGSRDSIGNNAIAEFDFFQEWGEGLGSAYGKVLAEAQRELRNAFAEEAPTTP